MPDPNRTVTDVLADVERRLIRIESKLHALADALGVSIDSQNPYTPPETPQ